MKKNILINEAQEKFILEAMRHHDALSNLPKHILSDLNNSNALSISDCEVFYNPLLKRYIEHAVIKRFEDITKYFLDDISNVNKDELSNKITKLIERIIKKEKPIRAQLETLCFNVLTELFDIPEDTFEYECHLVDGTDDNRSAQVHPEPINYDDSNFEEYSEANVLSQEIQKRRFMNLLCIGGSMCIYDKARDLYLSKVFELDEELPHLYSRLMKLNELFLFISRIKIRDGFLQQGGYVEVRLPSENRIAQVNVNAIIFPILLTESIRGMLELSASFGLPDGSDLSIKVMKIADSLEYEPWDMRLGPSFFTTIFSKINELDTKDLPFIFKGFSEEDYDTFFEVVKECCVNSKKGEDLINKLSLGYIHDKEYNDFEDNLMRKQNNNLLLNNQ